MSEYDLVACGVFQKEIDRLIPTLGFEVVPHYLDPGLHVDFDLLAGELTAVLKSCRHPIILAFGACHPRMSEIIAPYRIAPIDCQNCVDALLTRQEVERRANLGLYFYLSPGWIECWRDIFRRLGWGMEEARMTLGSFKGSVFMDTLGNGDSYEEELLQFLDYTLLPYEVVPGNLDHFRSLLIKAKDCLDRFIPS